VGVGVGVCVCMCVCMCVCSNWKGVSSYLAAVIQTIAEMF